MLKGLSHLEKKVGKYTRIVGQNVEEVVQNMFVVSPKILLNFRDIGV